MRVHRRKYYGFYKDTAMEQEVQSLQNIGNTPLIEFSKIEKEVEAFAKIFGKAEYHNAGGSIKDRVGKAIIEDAERLGKLQAGGTVVEATSGNTGIGLALVAKAKGYRSVIFMPDTMSVERQQLIKRYGGEVVLTDGKEGMQGAVAEAERFVKTTENCIMAGQFVNPVNAKAHYETTAPEIYTALQGKVDILVAGVGTGGTITGIGKFLKEKNPQTKVVAVEPASSPLLSKGYAGAHGLQGIGANFIPEILDTTVYDEVQTVTEEEAFLWAKTAREKEGAFIGISAGASLCVAVRLAKAKENAGKNIVVILPDGGDRYLSVKGFM